MMWSSFCIICLLAFSKSHAASLDRRYESSESAKSHTIIMKINGEQVSVVLPDAEENPPDLPQSITTLQHDDRVENQSLVIPPSATSSNSPADSQTAPISPASPTHAPEAAPTHSPETSPAHSPEVAPTHSPEVATTHSPETSPAHSPEVAPTHSPEASPVHSPEVAPTHSPEASPAHSPEVAPIHSPEASPTHSPEASPAHSPETSPAHSPEVAPTHSPEASSAHSPEVAPTHSPEAPPPSKQPEKHSQSTTNFVITAGFIPFFSSPLFFNNIFGPIYPVYTQSPMVVQFSTQPTIYYMQVIQIVHSIVPNGVIPLNSVMDLAIALTNILRSSAESLDSVIVQDSDGPNIAPQIEVSEDKGFRSALTGDPLEIPTPNDVTNEIQNAVQTYANEAPEEIQNELIKAMSENVADLLKPLYQNIAYTRKLRFDNDMDQEQLYRRAINLQRRSPEDVTDSTTAGVVQAINGAANNLVNTVNNLTSTASPVPHIPLPTVDLTSTTPHTPSALGAVAVANPSGSYSLSASSAPANQPPIVINNNYLGSATAAGTDLIDSLLNSATSPFSSVLSLIPNPFKIVSSIINTIATVYPKIQLSVLVGLSTAITQIIAKVLQIIASFVGIFAAIGRRDLSSIETPSPSSLDMEQVLKDLHTDIKDAVHTYLPEAPASKKKELTAALYSNSLDAISEAIAPMQDQVNKQNQEIPEQQVEASPQPIQYSNNENLRSKTDTFGFPDQTMEVKVSNNNNNNNNNNQLPPLPINDIMTGFGDNLFGAQDNFGKQIDQLTSDLGLGQSQDVLAIPNVDPGQQNNFPQINNYNQNNGFWNL